jgi:hypothetical protein
MFRTWFQYHNSTRMTLPAASGFAAAEAVAIRDYEPSTFVLLIAGGCGLWYLFIVIVQAIGSVQL